MKRYWKVLFLVCFGFLGASLPQNFSSKASFAIGFQGGYSNGIGFQGNFLVRNLAEGFPLDIKLGIGYSFLDPGNPIDTRKIFINDATNGVPEKAGRIIDFRADFLNKALARTYFYAGPRLAVFTGNFNFVGGNEDFDITSSQWGAGIGVENYFRMTPLLDLVFNFGYDYFFLSTLYGHDTSYSPDGQDVNARRDFTYTDADNAVNQPKHKIKAMVGLSYNF